MELTYDRASIDDYDEIIDLINYVFSSAHAPHDFPLLLPKLYKRDYFMDGIHYLAREGGKIKALVGAYPLAMEVSCGNEGTISLPGRGIGAVSVHPYCRSRGYMKALMHTAMEDMQRDGMIFSCLEGQRQRYEYFGYTPAGSVFSFCCTGTNITHTLGRQWKTGLSLEKVHADNTTLLDQIHLLHEAKTLRLHRDRDRLFDILSSWKAEIVAINEGRNFLGYFILKTNAWNNSSCITEIQLKDNSRLSEVLGFFLCHQKESGRGDTVDIYVGSHELEKIAILSGFTENYIQAPSCKCAVLNFTRLADALLKLKAASGKIREGSFVLQIEDRNKRSIIRIFANNNGIGAEETEEKPALSLNNLEAIRFLFSPLAAAIFPVIRENAFLLDALPLPFFIENADGV